MEALREGSTAGWKSSSNKLHATFFPLILSSLLFLPSVLPSPVVLLQFQSICSYCQPKARHYQSMLFAAGDCQVCLIQLFSFSHSLSSHLSLSAKPHCLYLSSFPAPPLPPLVRSLFLSVAARGTNRRPAELNVPIAESQMALAEGGAGSEVWMPPRRGAV